MFAAPVMLIDANQEDLFILKRLLSRAGVTNPLISFGAAEEAKLFLAAAGRTPESNLIPAAIFCDKTMPACDGFQLLEWVRRQPALKTVPFFLLTNNGQPGDDTRALELGATHFLEKFPSLQVLANLIHGNRGAPRAYGQH